MEEKKFFIIKKMSNIFNISFSLIVVFGLFCLSIYYLSIKESEKFLTKHLIELDKIYNTKDKIILNQTIKKLDPRFYLDENGYLRYQNVLSTKNIHFNKNGISFNINSNLCQNIINQLNNNTKTKLYFNGKKIHNLEDCFSNMIGTANINFI